MLDSGLENRCRTTSEDRPLEDKLRHLLQDLSRALSSAMAESSEVGDSLRRLRSSGYALYLSLDCKRDGELQQPPLPVAAGPVAGDPNFQINGHDLRFLRSIGIDPTRRLRPRRRRSG